MPDPECVACHLNLPATDWQHSCSLSSTDPLLLRSIAVHLPIDPAANAEFDRLATAARGKPTPTPCPDCHRRDGEIAEMERAENFPQTPATNCGRCGFYTHTPWRDDQWNGSETDYGYVCAACLRKLEAKKKSTICAEAAEAKQREQEGISLRYIERLHAAEAQIAALTADRDRERTRRKRNRKLCDETLNTLHDLIPMARASHRWRNCYVRAVEEAEENLQRAKKAEALLRESQADRASIWTQHRAALVDINADLAAARAALEEITEQNRRNDATSQEARPTAPHHL